MVIPLTFEKPFGTVFKFQVSTHAIHIEAEHISTKPAPLLLISARTLGPSRNEVVLMLGSANWTKRIRIPKALSIAGHGINEKEKASTRTRLNAPALNLIRAWHLYLGLRWSQLAEDLVLTNVQKKY